MSFLTEKAGPLPVWGWGAITAGLAFIAMSAGGGGGGGKKGPGGQGLIPEYKFKSTIDQNIGGDLQAYSSVGPGAGVSTIDGSFFGYGPLSLWTGGAMDYTGLFRDHRNRDRFRHDNRRPGGGGVGYHHWHGPGFPEAPVGGEGFDNNGQHNSGHSGSGRHDGGNPWAQQTQTGTRGDQYAVQKGDTWDSIANKLWGPGHSGDTIRQANGDSGGKGGRLTAGLLLTIPGAGHQGPPAPGGPAGNGIGGGSVSANGSNYGVAGAPYTGDSGSQNSPGAGTSSAGASGGGSPTANQSGGNSSRARRGNASQSYAMAGGGGGDSVKSPPNKKGRKR